MGLFIVKGIYPSPGACDEFIRCFVFRKAVDEKQLKELEGKATGLIQEGEIIKTKVIFIVQ